MTMSEPGTIARSAGLGSRLASVPLIAACVVAVAAFAALDLASDPERLTKALGDSDDATRLVQVRDLLRGAPWFDTTLRQFGAPDALVSHWSRLVDLGLAGLLALFGSFMPAASAELAMRAAWPLLLMVPLLWVMASWADSRSGRVAGLFAIVLGVTALTGTVEYLPGRIDHHNAMVLAAVAGIACLSRSFGDRRYGWAAGICLGLGTAVGYESIVLTMLTLATAGLIALFANRGGDGVLAAAQGYAETLLVAWLVTTAPASWAAIRCDALSVNLVVLAVWAAVGLWLVLVRGRNWPLATRLGAGAGAGAIGLALYGVMEPACLKGPFGQLDPAIGPLWMVNVTETQSVAWLLATAPVIGLVFLASVLLGLLAAWRLVRLDRDCGAVLVLVALAVAVALACWQIKLVPYASLLAVLPIAAVLARLQGSQAVSAPTARLLCLILASQFTLALILAPIAVKLVPERSAAAAWSKTAHACISTPNVTPLTALPAGLVFADRDLGPFIAALTPHRILVAPYHRMDKAIIEADRLWFGSSASAERRLRELGVAHVALCPGLTRTLGRRLPANSLHAMLHAGETPVFLEPVQMPGATTIRVWRMKRD